MKNKKSGDISVFLLYANFFSICDNLFSTEGVSFCIICAIIGVLGQFEPFGHYMCVPLWPVCMAVWPVLPALRS